MKLQNKTAIVTGSGQGIGLGIALALAKEGCNVVVSDINKETCDKATKEIASLGFKAISVPCDVSKKSDVGNLIYKAIESFGKVDILVNNAGIYPFKPFKDVTEEEWDKVMDINLKGVYLCCNAVLQVMKPGSRIINISSIASLVGFEGLVHYCTTKGGVNSFTRTLALETAPMNITVNAVAPGAIETPGTGMNEDNKDSYAVNIPLKRVGESSDIANAVVFFALDESGYITGQTLAVDGGWTCK